MPLTIGSTSSGEADPELRRKRRRLSERQLSLHDLPRSAMVIVRASLSVDDIRTLRLVSRDVCSLATACIKQVAVGLREHDELSTVERALEKFKGVPRLSVGVYRGTVHLLRARGLLPRMQGLYWRVSTASELDEVARILPGATRLRSATIAGTDVKEGVRLVANCLALETLELMPFRSPISNDDFRRLSGLPNLQSLRIMNFGHSEDLSPITCLTGLTELEINVGREVSLRPLAHLSRLISLAIFARWTANLPEDFVLSCLAAECRGNLKSLKLAWFGSVTAEAVRHLALCTSLVRLEIHGYKLPSLADMEPMLKSLPHLEICRFKREEWHRS